MGVAAEPAKPGWLAAALAAAESGPGWLQALQMAARMAALEREAAEVGTRRKGFRNGKPVTDEFRREQWERYLEVRRAYKEQEARAGASGQVFASISPQTRRLFGLDE
jgi:hypothetical protein